MNSLHNYPQLAALDINITGKIRKLIDQILEQTFIILVETLE